ncbi:hypothetical protein ACWD0J_11010, partial [Streptomyces sp. NPDC003011]
MAPQGPGGEPDAAAAGPLRGAAGGDRPGGPRPPGTATNNVAELTALERLLASTAPDVPLEVRMD